MRFVALEALPVEGGKKEEKALAFGSQYMRVSTQPRT